jgi:hypothetical protein
MAAGCNDAGKPDGAIDAMPALDNLMLRSQFPKTAEQLLKGCWEGSSPGWVAAQAEPAADPSFHWGFREKVPEACLSRSHGAGALQGKGAVLSALTWFATG